MTLQPTPPQSVPNPEPTSAARAAAEKNKPSEASPAPPPTFDVLSLSADVRASLAEMGYVHPTPVQIAVFEPAKRGKDLVVQARTGTGKTAAFGLPIVDHIVKRSVDRVQVLTLCPTRELALQVAAEVERLGKRRGVKVVAIYGGAPMQRQVDAIAGGAQVVCGTPGRVLDHLRRGTLDPRGVRLVVLDESDEMLSMGFERELNAILEHLPADRQTLLFSATLPPDIERIAKNRLKSPEFVTLSGDHVGALSIHHYVYMVNSDKITAFLRMIEVENPESAIVFCNTKDETERLASALQRQGFEADWLNGDLDQGEREKVMSATREGRIRFLVATDVAARGIDISHLTHVINFDFPQDAESYVHRTGRTGRAGRTGTAIALVTPQDIGQLYLLRLTYKIKPIEKQIPSESELKTRAETDLVAMFAEGYGKKPVHPDDLSIARRLLTHDSADVIIAGLLRDHLGARPTVREEASANRRAAKPRPADPPPREARPAAPRSEPEARPASTVEVAPSAQAPKAIVAAPVEPVHAVPVSTGTAPLTATPQVMAPRASTPPPISVPTPSQLAVTVQLSAIAPAPPVQVTAPLPAVTVAAPAPAVQVTAPIPVVAAAAPSAPALAVGVEAALPSKETAAPSSDASFGTTPLTGLPVAAKVAPADEPVTATSGVPEGELQGSQARGQEGRYGRRDDRRGERGRRGRDNRYGDAPREPGRESRGTRADFTDRPIDRARPAQSTSHDPMSSPAAQRPAALPEGSAPKTFVRHADFTTWQPPEEEGDDEPIWGNDSRRPHGPTSQTPHGAPSHGGPSHAAQAPHMPPAAPAQGSAQPSEDEPQAPAEGVADSPLPFGETVELHATVGRRDGARASDLVRLLEKAGLSKDSVQRVRVRERHAFLTVRKEDEARAIAALNGAQVAGRTVAAERARERPSPDGRAPETNGGDGEP